MLEISDFSSFEFRKEKNIQIDDKDNAGDMREVIKLVQSQLETNRSVFDLITQIVRITPSDISLNSFHYDYNGKLFLAGETPRFSRPYEYVTILENDEYFKDVTVEYATRRQIGEQETIVFKISGKVAE